MENGQQRKLLCLESGAERAAENRRKSENWPRNVGKTKGHREGPKGFGLKDPLRELTRGKYYMSIVF